MRTWIDRLLLVAIVGITLVLALTAVPVLFGHHLTGPMLLVHMMASGALVFALPSASLLWTWRYISRAKSGALQRIGFWALLLTGLATIATVFVCMLPIAATEQMHQLIQWHGYAGFAMVPALLVLLIGNARWRRIQLMRSEMDG